MKITIIETGKAPGRLSEEHPRYPAMFEAMMGGADPAFTFETVRLIEGDALPAAASREAIMITGSPSGVYDATPWMEALRQFLRDAHAAKTPTIGVCFGHQILSDALGGVVRKSDKGWGIGRHTYDIVARRDWMAGESVSFSLSASHQDQVISPPPGVVTLARSAHTDHAMLEWPDAPILSLQGHPEFDDTFIAALYGARRGVSLTDAQVDTALKSLERSHDNAIVGEWLTRFLRSAAASRRS